MDQHFLWLDMEMTGLDTDKDEILEVAAVLTKEDLVPIASYSAVVGHHPEVLRHMNLFVWNMHMKNGLIAACSETDLTVAHAERAVVRMLVDAGIRPGEAILAGNSVHFDRAFIKRLMPMLDRYLHYRLLDVTALRLLAEAVGVWPESPEGTPEDSPTAHRAMPDVENCLVEARHYRACMRREIP